MSVEALSVLRDSLDSAQTELAQAELALCEATARAEAAREGTARLEAAVAALSGEPPPAVTEDTQIGNKDTQDTPIPATNPDRQVIQDLSPEEFDAQRKKRQRERQKEEQANNPYAHIKCSGCGSLGTLNETVIQAPSGAPVRMMICGSCGNQLIS